MLSDGDISIENQKPLVGEGKQEAGDMDSEPSVESPVQEESQGDRAHIRGCFGHKGAGKSLHWGFQGDR